MFFPWKHEVDIPFVESVYINIRDNLTHRTQAGPACIIDECMDVVMTHCHNSDVWLH